MDFIKRILHSLLVLARDAFPYTLIFYLVLFLLENLFPGFVSSNFNLNWVLAAVLINGLLAAFAPEPQKKEPEKPIGKNDYLMVSVLGLVGGAIIFAKMGGSNVARWATAAISSMLIMFLGLVTLSGEDQIPDESEEVIAQRESTPAIHIHWKNALPRMGRVLRPFLLRRVELPIVYVLVFIIFTALLIPKNITLITNSLRRPAPVQTAEAPMQIPLDEPFYWDDLNALVNIPPSEELAVSILNGGGARGVAATFSAILRENGFTNVEIGNADRYDYKNAQIRFAEADKPQATVIKRLLKLEYPIILELPADASASGVTVVLGIKEETQ